MTTVIVSRSITSLSFLVSLYNSTDPHATTDLLSITRDWLAFSRVLYKGNHTVCTLGEGLPSLL